MDVELSISDLLNSFAEENARVTRRAIMAEAQMKAWQQKANELQAELAQVRSEHAQQAQERDRQSVQPEDGPI